MKKHKKFLVSLLLLQVFLMTSVKATSFSGSSLDLNSHTGNFFKTYQNDKAVLFEEITSKTEVRFSSEDDLHSFNLEVSFTLRQTYPVSAYRNFSGLHFNKKELLKIQIFPFHFFW